MFFNAKPSPRTGKGDREAVEEVHGRTGKNKTQLQVLTSVVAPRMGAKRGMPVASLEKGDREAKAVPAHGESGPQGRKGSMGEDLRMNDDAAGCIPASARS